MTLPAAAALEAAMAATWPPHAVHPCGPFTLREGRGGGSRVSAATADAAVDDAAITQAEAAMRAWGQVPLFMLRTGEDALDAALAARGYRVKDPVFIRAAPVAALATRRPPPVSTFEVWPPLAAQAEIWAEAGIGPARLAVMARVQGPRVSILGRLDDRPAGVAFVACHGRIAMVHAVEVARRARRRGLAVQMMRAAAFWAAAQGADEVALAVTRDNAGANALYAFLGMGVVGQYHYRIAPETPAP